MRINSKNAHKKKCTQLRRINFLSSKKKMPTWLTSEPISLSFWNLLQKWRLWSVLIVFLVLGHYTPATLQFALSLSKAENHQKIKNKND